MKDKYKDSPVDGKDATVNKILMSSKVKHGDKNVKYFTGYVDSHVVKSLPIMLPQLNGYIKYFKSGGKNVSFMITINAVQIKYNDIFDKIRRFMQKEFGSKPDYDDKYIKTKIRIFDGLVHINFHSSEVPQEDM